MADSPDLGSRNKHEKRTVTLELCGQRFSVRSDDAEEYLHKLAAHINDKIAEIRTATGRVETGQVALLALLDITDALFRAKAKNKSLQVDILARSERLLHSIDEMASSLEFNEASVQPQTAEISASVES